MYYRYNCKVTSPIQRKHKRHHTFYLLILSQAPDKSISGWTLCEINKADNIKLIFLF